MMDLTTAQGAITMLKIRSNFESAFQSYFAGHDDKHRNPQKAYATNHDSDDPDRPQGYYRKEVIKIEQTGEEVKSVWGQKPTTQAVFGPVTRLENITVDDEIDLLFGAVCRTGGYYLTSPFIDRFGFGCPITKGFRGFTFEGGGNVFPKKPVTCDAMILVIAVGSSNVQLVTHYPTHRDVVLNHTKLT